MRTLENDRCIARVNDVDAKQNAKALAIDASGRRGMDMRKEHVLKRRGFSISIEQHNIEFETRQSFFQEIAGLILFKPDLHYLTEASWVYLQVA